MGIDFLQKFKMSIDLCNKRLLHSGVSTRFSSASSEISGVNVVRVPTPGSVFAEILRDFPEVTDAALASRTSKHGVECFIHTNGPPIRTVPRHLFG